MLRSGSSPGDSHVARLLRSWLVIAIVAGLALGAGCTSYRGPCVPNGLLTPEGTIDLNATSTTDHSHEREALTATLARLKSASADGVDATAKKHNVLALSGGGSYGAYTAGLLNGWTASGQRPQFDIVSGVSTGALIATYAFLGPRYDPALREFYTQTCTDDIYKKRFKPAVLCTDSFALSAPLAQLIDQRVTPQILCEVAAAHAQGRRLYIGSTNVDTGRLVIWDMGAIAARGTPEALTLYRQIILASAS
ncbi:MAG: patatin-like phospholipase family protein, partial [Singulisphaera sp.]